MNRRSEAGQDAQAKQICVPHKKARNEAGEPVIAAAMIEAEGEPKRLPRRGPDPVQLQLGASLIVDRQPSLIGAFRLLRQWLLGRFRRDP